MLASPFKALLSLGLVVALCLSCADASWAKGKRKRLKMSKARNYRITRNLSSVDLSSSPSLISETIENRIFESSPDIYPLNIRFPSYPLLERDPLWDHREAERGAQRIFAAQSTMSLISLVKGSDLRDYFYQVESAIKSTTKLFTYSIQDTGKGYSLSNDNKGQDLVKFSLKFSLSRGADPLISISDTCRIRYDISNSRTMLEYGFDF